MASGMRMGNKLDKSGIIYLSSLIIFYIITYVWPEYNMPGIKGRSKFSGAVD